MYVFWIYFFQKYSENIICGNCKAYPSPCGDAQWTFWPLRSHTKFILNEDILIYGKSFYLDLSMYHAKRI